MVKILVLFYGYGSIVDLAKEIAKGAEEEGAETRIRKVRETLYPELIQQFHIPLDSTKDIPEVTLDDLKWADGIAIGSPTRYGNMAGGMKTFLDSTALYGETETYMASQ